MKIFHLSDLHIGKKVYDFSMIPDQEYILNQILNLAEAEKPGAVILAGDIYDRTVPPAEAVSLMDSFLEKMAELCPAIFIISGNHDSPERLAFGGGLMEKSGVYISPVYNGTVKRVTLEDQWGPVDFYLLPFIKPAHVRAALNSNKTDKIDNEEESEKIRTCTEAVKEALKELPVNKDAVNIILSHQFVTGAVRSESEEVMIGGLDNVDASAYENFDYVALGHIHGPQTISGKPGQIIRYCGTPLKYSFSESGQEKSITVLETGAGGKMETRNLPLKPLREMVEIKGTYSQVTERDFYKDTNWQEDYVRITLTDEQDIPDAMARLRSIYKNLMRLDYDNARTRNNWTPEEGGNENIRTPEELIGDFYSRVNGYSMNDNQKAICKSIFEGLSKKEMAER